MIASTLMIEDSYDIPDAVQAFGLQNQYLMMVVSEREKEREREREKQRAVKG